MCIGNFFEKCQGPGGTSVASSMCAVDLGGRHEAHDGQLEDAWAGDTPATHHLQPKAQGGTIPNIEETSTCDLRLTSRQRTSRPEAQPLTGGRGRRPACRVSHFGLRGCGVRRRSENRLANPIDAIQQILNGHERRLNLEFLE